MPGEEKLLKFLSDVLDDSYEVYFQPFINGNHPDIVIVRRRFGVLLIEVKDWNLELFSFRDEESWRVRVAGGVHQLVKSPVKQAKKYVWDFYNLYLRDFYQRAFMDSRYYAMIETGIFFSSAGDEDLVDFEMRNKGVFPNRMHVFGKDALNSRESFFSALKNAYIFGVRYSFLFTNNFYRDVQRILRPTMHTQDRMREERITLSPKQKELAKSIAGRKTKVRGVAGSGKTKVLAELAVDAFRRTHSAVLILMYNITLRNYIRDAVNAVRNRPADGRFIISHYHLFIKDYWTMNIAKKCPEDLNSIVLKDAPVKYKTILVDEVQDYQKQWILNLYSLLAEDGELVFFGDEKQNVYSRSMLPEDGKGGPRPFTGLKGPWHMLKETYRLDDGITRLANQFQRWFFASKYEFDEIEPVEQTLNFSDTMTRYYYFDEFSVEDIFEIYQNTARDRCLNDNDICFLCRYVSPLRRIEAEFLNRNYRTTTTFETEAVYQTLKKSAAFSRETLGEQLYKIRRSKKFNFYMEAGKIKFSTIQSFKGWELTTIFLLIMGEEFREETDIPENYFQRQKPQDELIYTALTRARSNLIVINMGNKKYDGFFRENMQTFDCSVPF